jgi:hypothetical protein
MSNRKSPSRVELEERVSATKTQKAKRIGPLKEQLEGCKSDEARRLIIHGIAPRSKKNRGVSK